MFKHWIHNDRHQSICNIIIKTLCGKRKFKITSVNGDKSIIKKRVLGQGAGDINYNIICYSVPIVTKLVFVGVDKIVT